MLATSPFRINNSLSHTAMKVQNLTDNLYLLTTCLYLLLVRWLVKISGQSRFQLS